MCVRVFATVYVYVCCLLVCVCVVFMCVVCVYGSVCLCAYAESVSVSVCAADCVTNHIRGGYGPTQYLLVGVAVPCFRSGLWFLRGLARLNLRRNFAVVFFFSPPY